MRSIQKHARTRKHTYILHKVLPRELGRRFLVRALELLVPRPRLAPTAPKRARAKTDQMCPQREGGIRLIEKGKEKRTGPPDPSAAAAKASLKTC